MKKHSIGFVKIWDSNSMIREFDDYNLTGWSEVKHIVKELNEKTGENVSFKLSSYSSRHQKRNIIKLNDTVTVYLTCDTDLIIDLLTTDIVKTDIKKISLKREKFHGRAVYKDHYQAKYIFKKQQNGIESYSFHTNDKELFRQFVEGVSVKALPSGKIDAPTNKKLAKINRRALKRVNTL